jgi:hypothetical protein
MKTARLTKLICSSFMLALMSQGLLATDVSGTIVNQIWTSNTSPYRVVGDILVAGLTIKPGVTVLSASNCVFEVAGKLKAIGTPDSPILFTATNTGWQGLYFNTAQPGCELAHCIVEKASHSGIRVVASSPAISDCIIRLNTNSASGFATSVAASGGGICSSSPLTLINCIIQGNIAITTSSGGVGGAAIGTSTSLGGGIYSEAPMTLLHCTIVSNICSALANGANPIGGGVALSGGAGVFSSGQLTLKNCIITGNSATASSPAGLDGTATSRGAGVYGAQGCSQINTLISHNSATSSAPTGTAETSGGGAFVATADGSFENCTIAFNTPDGLRTDRPQTSVLNSILWGNSPSSQVVGTTNITYCDVQGGIPGVGNISGNPIFLSSSDLIIVLGSPCIGTGSTNAAYRNVYFPPSLGDSGNDMGAHGGPGAGARFRARLTQQFEVIFLGGVPGYTYLLQGSTNLLDWETVKQVQIAHLGDTAYFLEPPTNALPRRFYKLNVAP